MQINPITTPTQQTHLLPLLDYLHQNAPDATHTWDGWTIERVLGGQNNLVYHAGHECGDFAVKFTRRDERNRAGREFNALLTLQLAGLNLAPKPYLLADDHYDQLAVVQSWLAGLVSATVPHDETEWRQLLKHILLVQSVRRESTAVHLPPATLSATHPRQLLEHIKQWADKLPPDARLAPLQRLLAKLETRQYPNWPTPPLSLLHCDPNLLNFVRPPEATSGSPSGWLAVDWENSGWGDPALEVADLLAHAAFMDVSLETWHWVVTYYGERCEDETAVTRIWAYYPFLLGVWVAIFTRGMYDLENGLPNERLAPRPADWAETMPVKYNHYLNLAFSVISNR